MLSVSLVVCEFVVFGESGIFQKTFDGHFKYLSGGGTVRVGVTKQTARVASTTTILLVMEGNIVVIDFLSLPVILTFFLFYKNKIEEE